MTTLAVTVTVARWSQSFSLTLLPQDLIAVSSADLIPFVEADKVIRFHSDSSNPSKGFSIRARQLSCGSRRIGTGPTGRKLEGPVCNNETPFNALTFEIESPGYPEAYGQCPT